MAIDGHLLEWVNDIRQKPEKSTQTMLTTDLHILSEMTMARSIENLDGSG